MNQLNLFWETWLDVVGYEGLYKVNGRGDVKSINYNHTRMEKLLKQTKVVGGYLRVGLSKNGKQKMFFVHRLVYEAFYGEIPSGMEIDHFDFTPENNTVENLRCIPAKENNQKKSDEWRNKVSEANKKRCSKPVNEYTLDDEFVKTWQSANEAARQLGFSQANISYCCNGKYKQAYGKKWAYA